MAESLKGFPLEWVVLAAGALLLASALLLITFRWFLRRRARRRAQDGEPSPAELRRIVARYRKSHPSFYRILSELKRGHAEGMLERGEVRAALRLLAVEGKKNRQDDRASLLELTAGTKNPETRIQAAMLTILRVVYSDPKLRDALSKKADRELDLLLDDLTG